MAFLFSRCCKRLSARSAFPGIHPHRRLNRFSITPRRQATAFHGRVGFLPLRLPSLSSIEWRSLSFSRTLPRSVRDVYFRDSAAAARRRVPLGPPPGNSWWERFVRRVNRIPPTVIVYTICGLNILVYIMWKIGEQNYTRFRDPQVFVFLMRNFTTSWDNFKQGRLWTIITSCFSQRSETHLFVNLLVFFFSAGDIMSIIGPARFLMVYLGSGIASSVTSIWWRGNQPGNSLGASGATYGVFSLFACMFPSARLLLFFVIPVPAWACMGGLFCWDLFNMVTSPPGRGGGTDTAGHVGGILAGAAFYYFRFRRLM